ncbi:hypothetical protein Hanom_Chr07g00648911 [Helianthus anomalus]
MRFDRAYLALLVEEASDPLTFFAYLFSVSINDGAHFPKFVSSEIFFSSTRFISIARIR